MVRTSLMRVTAAALLAVSLAVPRLASATPRDDLEALAESIRMAGRTEEAAQIEQLLTQMSDTDLEVLGDAAIDKLTAAFLEVAEARTLSESVSGERITRMADGFGTLPDGDYPPTTHGSPAVDACPSETERSDFSASYTAFLALGAARIVLDTAKDVLAAVSFGCMQTTVGIGVGGNIAIPCVVLSIAVAAADAILSSFELAYERIEFCDGNIDSAEIEGSYDRLGHLHTDIETHDTNIMDKIMTHDVDIKDKVMTHDAEIKQALSVHDADIKQDISVHDADIKALLANILARLAIIEGKVDLGLKSQLEIAMNTKFKARPSIFYEDRLDELCGYAQEAVNDLPVVYLVSSQAQEYVDRGMATKLTDPKGASDSCLKAFELATRRSRALQ